MRTTFVSALLAGAIALGAQTAAAQIDVNLAFNPDAVSPGQCVTFFSSVANLGTEPVTACLGLTVKIAGCTFGPIRATRCLGAGQECSTECRFTIPWFMPAGTLTLSLTGTAGTSSDCATASLTVNCNSTAAPTTDQLRTFGDDVLAAVAATPVATESNTFSAVKNLYR